MSEFQKKRKFRVNLRSVHNLCPNCFSQLIPDETGSLSCTGDRLQQWQEELDKYLALPPNKQKDFLSFLSNPDGFLNIVNLETKKVYCGFNTKITPIVSDGAIRIPDPLMVNRFEKNLGRRLSEEELEEGYIFKDGSSIEFINFPEDV